jgi:hypothetical protein
MLTPESWMGYKTSKTASPVGADVVSERPWHCVNCFKHVQGAYLPLRLLGGGSWEVIR